MSLLVLAHVNQYTHLHCHDSAKPFYKPLSNEAVYLSTKTELNHRNYTVCKMDMQVQFLRCKHKHKGLYVGGDDLIKAQE